MKLSFDIRLKKVTVSIDILIFIFIITSLIMGFFVQYILTLGFIAAHESGHIIAAVKSGAGVYRLRILPVGLNAEIDYIRCSRKERIIIYLAGPLTNIMLAFLLILLNACHFVGEGLMSVVYINMWLAFFNLLPLIPLDGGKIAVEFLSGHFGLFRANRQMRILSIMVSAGIICLGLVIFKQTLYNASAVLIGIYILLCIRENRKETAFMNIKSFIFKRSRFNSTGICPARHIVVNQKVRLSEVIKAMDYSDVFHIVNVVDTDLHIIGVLTEQEIVDSLVLYSTDITFEKLLSLSKK